MDRQARVVLLYRGTGGGPRRLLLAGSRLSREPPGINLRGRIVRGNRDTSATGSWTSSFDNIQCYDALKVKALLHEIAGKTHWGTAAVTPRSSA